MDAGLKISGPKKPPTKPTPPITKLPVTTARTNCVDTELVNRQAKYAIPTAIAKEGRMPLQKQPSHVVILLHEFQVKCRLNFLRLPNEKNTLHAVAVTHSAQRTG